MSEPKIPRGPTHCTYAHLPVEIWYQIFHYLRYFDLHNGLKPVNRLLYSLVISAKARLHGLTPDIWDKIIEDETLYYRELQRLSRVSSDLRNLIRCNKSLRVLDITNHLPLSERERGRNWFCKPGSPKFSHNRLHGGFRFILNPAFYDLALDDNNTLCFRSPTYSPRPVPVSSYKLGDEIYEPENVIWTEWYRRDPFPPNSVLTENATDPPVAGFELKVDKSHSFRVWPKDANDMPMAVTVNDIIRVLREAINTITTAKIREGRFYNSFSQRIGRHGAMNIAAALYLYGQFGGMKIEGQSPAFFIDAVECPRWLGFRGQVEQLYMDDGDYWGNLISIEDLDGETKWE